MGQISELLGKKMKEVIRNQVNFIEGNVISTSPLKIEVIGNSQWVIPRSLIILPKTLTDYTLKVDFTVGGSKVENIKIYNSLQVGDKVMMIAFNLMQRYYILDRIGG